MSEKHYRQFRLITCFFYVFCLMRDMISYCHLLRDCFFKKQISDELSLYDVLSDNIAPDTSEVIVRTVYLAVFISLTVWFAAFKKQDKKLTSRLLGFDLYITGTIVLIETIYFGAALISSSVLSVIFAAHIILLLLLALSLFLMGRISMQQAEYKRELRIAVYAAALVLVLIERTIFTSVTPLSVADMSVFVMLAVLGGGMTTDADGSGPANEEHQA